MGRASASYLYPLTANVLWGSVIVALKYVVSEGFSPPAVSGIRFAAATIVFGSVAVARRRMLPPGSRLLLPVLVLAGAVFAANQLDFVFALRHASATVVALVNGLAPLMVVALGAAVGLERMQARVVAAGALSFSGVALVVLGARGTELAVGAVGIVLCLLMPFSWGVYSLIATRPSRLLPAEAIGAVVMAVAFLLVLPVAAPPAIEQGTDFGWQVWACLGYSFVGGLLLPTLLWLRALEHVGPGRSMVFVNVQPITAVLLAWLLLGEPLSPTELAGGAAIVGGILLVTTGAAHAREIVPASE